MTQATSRISYKQAKQSYLFVYNTGNRWSNMALPHLSVKLLLVPTKDDMLPIRGFESP